MPDATQNPDLRHLEALIGELRRLTLGAGSIHDETRERIRGLAFLLRELDPEEVKGVLDQLDFRLPLSDDGLETLEALRDLFEENRRLAELTVTDSLTGLYNVRHFRERLRVELERTARTERPCSLIMIDLDKFKSVNDTHGHPAGDELLKNVAEILRTHIRAMDVPVRYGGDELAVIMPDSGTLEAQRTAERLCRQLERDPRCAQYGVTGSFGLATHHPYGPESPDELVARADQALYESKRAGGNRVWFFEADVAAEKPSEVTAPERDDLFAALQRFEE